MRVAITGASGFIGGALRRHLIARGHEVVAVSRGTPDADTVHWDPRTGEIERDRLEGVDACVHLAGESIGGRRWTEGHKARVLDSRVRGTRLIAEALAALGRRPQVLVSASAVGYYGSRGDERLSEDSPPGAGFMAEVCRQWEQSTQPAAEAGIRVVRTRSGLVLARRGGLLPRMLLPFRLGLGGRVGSGRQWWPWITLEDELRAITWCLERDVVGPVNLTAPNPVRNEEFTHTLAALLHRPAVLPLPALALEVALGTEMAHDLLLASQRVLPERLLAGGFVFSHPALEEGLRRELAR